MTMDELHTHAPDLAAWLDCLPFDPLTDAQIEFAMTRFMAERVRQTASTVHERTAEEERQHHAIAARAIAEDERQRHEEQTASGEQKIHIWIAACDHLASLTNEAFADWLEDDVFVQFPIQTPMSDILSEVIDRLRRLSEESAP
jgi:hypothetical protein